MAESDPWGGWLVGSLEGRRNERRVRQLRSLAASGATRATVEGRSMVLFSTNDYLGLSQHPAVREAAAEAALRWGMGPRGSALVCGYTEQHEELEEALAELEQSEAVLLFPTGYAANSATLAALAGPDLTIFSDALNHASIIDGCRLADRRGTQVVVYRHADLEDLAAKLEACQSPRRLIVSDSLFSMDGDFAPLRGLVELKERYGAWLLLDEAHATLVFGRRGAGVAELTGVGDRVEIKVGTLSKAFGAQGGFVACSRRLRRWLLNSGRPFVFSTALPLPTVAAAREALAVRQREPELASRVLDFAQRVAKALGQPTVSPIVPWQVGGESRALELASELGRRGFWVPAIRPPTVPVGTSRLRFTLSAAHTAEEVEQLAALLVGLRSPVPQ